MPSPQAYAMLPLLRTMRFMMGRVAGGDPHAWARFVQRSGSVAERFTRAPRGVRIELGEVGGVPGSWVDTPTARSSPVVLYFHGGAMLTLMTGPLVKVVAARLALATGLRVFGPDYRILPDHHYPDGHDDCFRAYAALAQSGVAPPLVGDSSGGVLALSTMLRARAAGLPMPPICILLSPTVDFVFTDPGVMSSHDAFGHPKALVATHRAYAAGQDSSNADITPVDQDLSGLPTLDVHCGEKELLSTEVDRLEAAAHRFGVPINVHRWPAMWHGWYIMADRLPEGRQVLDDAGAAILQAITTNA